MRISTSCSAQTGRCFLSNIYLRLEYKRLEASLLVLIVLPLSHTSLTGLGQIVKSKGVGVEVGLRYSLSAGVMSRNSNQFPFHFYKTNKSHNQKGFHTADRWATERVGSFLYQCQLTPSPASKLTRITSY